MLTNIDLDLWYGICMEGKSNYIALKDKQNQVIYDKINCKRKSSELTIVIACLSK